MRMSIIKRIMNATMRRALRFNSPLIVYIQFTLNPLFFRPFIFLRREKFWTVKFGRKQFHVIKQKHGIKNWSLLHNLLEPYDVYSRIKEGNIVLDAGASIGEQTLLYAKSVGQKGRVIAIEASPERAAILRRNLAINHLDNVTVIVGALWNKIGEIELEFYAEDGLKVAEESRNKTRVKTYTLDQIAQEFSLKAINFLKMDIEGSEYEVLKDTQVPIKGMGMETHTVNEVNTAYPIRKLLTERRYSVRIWERKDGLHILNAWL